MTVTTELPATVGIVHDAPSARDLEDLVREHMPMVGHLVRELLNRVPGHVHADVALQRKHRREKKFDAAAVVCAG